MIAASAKSPSANWSTTAASSIHGTGAQNLPSALTQRLRGRVRRCVWTERLQPTAGLVALEAARQIILRRSCRFGWQSTCRGWGSIRGHRLVETPCHRALRRFRDVGRLGRILSATTRQ